MNPRALSLTLTALIIFNPLLAAAAAIERDAPNTYAIEPILPLQESASAEMPEGFVFKNTEDPSISINENLPASINSPENIHFLILTLAPD